MTRLYCYRMDDSFCKNFDPYTLQADSDIEAIEAAKKIAVGQRRNLLIVYREFDMPDGTLTITLWEKETD